MRAIVVVLAAGRSSRMGVDKLALSFQGERLLYRALAPYICSARVDRVLLVTQPGFAWPDQPARCQVVANPRHEQGIGTSLAAGIAAAPDADVYLVALADMPGLSIATLGRLLDAFEHGKTRIVRPFYQGRCGHPVLIHGNLRDRLLALDGDIGAREMLAELSDEVTRIDVDDPGVVLDIDTPADLLRSAIPRLKVLITGAGEMASATAHRLFQCGFMVVMTDTEHPTAIRRLVSFASAIQCGQTEVEGVPGVGYRLDQATMLASFDRSHVPVFIDPDAELVRLWRPDVLIDARLLKRPSSCLHGAPLTIGLGPGLRAGVDVHHVIETNRGHNLARLISHGTAEPDTGVPGSIAGRTEERIVRAPGTGRFEAACEIGEVLEAGAVVGSVNEQQIPVAISGVVRGLIHPGYHVVERQKIGDIDPRSEPAYCATISEKARAISGTCLHVILSSSAGTAPTPGP